MKNKKITTIGESLIDWVCLDKTTDLYEANEFIKAAGGAPANVAVGLSKLNYPVQFVGGFSTDIFGGWLKEFLSSFNVDMSTSLDIENSNTRNAYILTNKNGNRVLKGFSMHCCADSLLSFEDINIELIKQSPIIYFGSLLQASEKTRNTIDQIINCVKGSNLIVYDPNLRTCMWNNIEDAVNIINSTINKVDVVKLSDDEIDLITKIDDIEEAAKHVFNSNNLKLLVVTIGSKGSFYINKSGSGYVKPYSVEPVEVTGAGDAFLAGILGGFHDILQENSLNNFDLIKMIEDLPCKTLENIMKRANAIGALTTLKAGATSSLPTREELTDFLQSQI